MSRLIDADALMQSLDITNIDCDKCAWHDDSMWMGCKRGDDFEDVCCAIEDAPTIEERKNGKWIKMSDADGVYWACSECGEDIPRVPHYNPQFDLFPRLESIEKTNFCPNCGADMREVNQIIDIVSEVPLVQPIDGQGIKECMARLKKVKKEERNEN